MQDKTITHIQLQSSTLVEVLVAMVIIMITTGIIFPIIFKSHKESNIIQQSQAIIIGRNTLEHMIAHDSFEETETEYNGFTIHTSIQNNLYNLHIKNITITVTDESEKNLFSQTYSICVQ